jgi:arginyl-tRNA synthetase
MNLDATLQAEIQKAVSALFNQQVDTFQLQPTNQEFEGSHTLVCFPLTKISRLKPEETANMIGEYLVQHSGVVSKYNVVKGFLNLVLSDQVWVKVLQDIYAHPEYGQLPPNGQEIMIEYSSPNTNKPLHLGHLRNNFLGWSVSEIYKANGYAVHKVQIINDRGIHICKSMAAWKLFGDGETPHNTGVKGDHLVGKYYVEFDKAYKAQINALTEKGLSQEEAEKQAPIMQLASEMLRKWEQKDPETVELWSMMNGWVYEGFEETYKKMGVDFDKLYYESDTYLLGKEEVLNGVETGVFFKKEDGSVWVDLTPDGLDQKVLLRSDGTSVYMTQDIGTAILRKAESTGITVNTDDLNAVTSLEPAEREALQVLSTFESEVREAAKAYAPSIIANYVYELAKEYNQFYQSIPIFSETNPAKLKFRIALSRAIADAIHRGMGLLGIEVPERM